MAVADFVALGVKDQFAVSRLVEELKHHRADAAPVSNSAVPS